MKTKSNYFDKTFVGQDNNTPFKVEIFTKSPFAFLTATATLPYTSTPTRTRLHFFIHPLKL
jgi:hypothetical protein